MWQDRRCPAQAGAASVNVPGAAGETVEYLASEDWSRSGGSGYGFSRWSGGCPSGTEILYGRQWPVEPVDIVDSIEHGLFAPEKVLTEGEEIYYQYCSAFPIGAMGGDDLEYRAGL